MSFDAEAEGPFNFTARRIKGTKHHELIVELAKRADLGILGLALEIRPFPETVLEGLSEDMRKRLPPEFAEIKVLHRKFGPNNEPAGEVAFDLQNLESGGTKKFVALLGHLCTRLEGGGIVVIDEFDAKLHPLLTRAIVSLFLSSANQGNAQLIIATHDTHLMDPDLFRRDQIWFTQKDEFGATTLYSLAEFDPNQVRPTSKFNQQYLLGIFGAVPKICLEKPEPALAEGEEN